VEQSRSIEFGVGYVGGTEPMAQWRERAAYLDRSPVDQLWVSDERFYRDPWVMLTMMADVTQRIRLGTSVTDPFVRHPALTASAVASLAEASGGRAVLGMGAGVSGFAAMRIERRRPATALREATELIRQLIQGERVDYEGKVVSFHDSGLSWLPAYRVPIYLAGRGPKILQLGGEVGDGVLIASFSGGPMLDYAFEHVGMGLSRRDPILSECKKVSWLYTSIGDDLEACRDAVRRGVAVAVWGSFPILKELDLGLPTELIQYMESRPYSLEAEVIDGAARLIPASLIDDLSLTGSPERCAERIQSLIERGIDQISIWPFAPLGADVDDTVRAFVEAVVPRVIDRTG
jgi:5,10-methylenetetrahydromethanopterin reductase